MQRLIQLLGILLICVALGGAAIALLGTGTVTIGDKSVDQLLQRLQQLVLIAAVVERVVEVYLKASGLNGEDRHDPNDLTGKSAERPATFAALLVGAIIAVCGLTVLNSFVDVGALGFWQRLAWNGVDVLLTACLIAGGSSLLHEVAETIQGLTRFADPARAEAQKAKSQQIAAQQLAHAQTIAGTGKPS